MFTSPLAFLWLALVGPVLVLLYLIRQEARVYPVPSILHFLPLPEAQVPVARRLARFVRDPLFYVQLLLLALLVVALAGPVRERSVRHTVFIIDTTASMQAKEGQTTRLQLAVRRATELLAELGQDDRVAVLAAGRSVRRVASFAASKEELTRNLNGIQPTDTAGTCGEAVFVAANLLMSVGGGEVVLFTDSPFALPETLGKEGLNLRVVAIGTKRANVGIVSLDTPVSLMSGGGHLMAQLRNFGPDTVDAEVSVSVNEAETGRTKARIPPMGSQQVDFDLKGQSGLAHVELHHEDALAVDNHAYAWLPPDEKLTILIVSARTELKGVLGKLEVFQVSHRPPQDFAEPLREQPDILLFDGWSPARSPESNAIFINPQSSTDIFTVAGEATGEVYCWEEGHPLIDQVILDNLRPETCPKIEPGDGMVVVVGGQRSAILAAPEKGDRRQVVCALPLHKAINQPTELLLLFRMLEWVNPRSQTNANTFPAGMPLTVRALQLIAPTVVTTPSGERVPAHPSEGRLIFGQTDRIGPYRVSGPGFERVLIAALASPEESDLTQPAVSTEDTSPVEVSPKGTAKSSYSPWLLLLAPFLMLLEWLAFHKRGA